MSITALLIETVIAPLPPCTPFLWVNKMVESNNWSSDMNPYYPVKPCPYSNPNKAPLHMRFAIFSGPAKLMYHVGTELLWFFTTGSKNPTFTMEKEAIVQFDIKISSLTISHIILHFTSFFILFSPQNRLSKSCPHDNGPRKIPSGPKNSQRRTLKAL